jgi:hypothetical protein
MKITVVQASDGPADISVFLTEREAEEVVRALGSRLVGDTGHEAPGYHLHLQDGDGSELTIGVLDPE